ncbi:mersacidin/lichenicidin family type 2 lantibiotic [Chamaesiphon minutus]|uniref:Type 2 lantibiotic, mersacidin/lichenicidin family n=1 Tax=Chamaesiphon minutus (strain ATCC 27169 / PCC 6605) TaxID=1173020 RepID=K9UFY2_CHAP6|nr:mersacidin/lichenicidin family type 2 lantibiotic [Chamaesiphon minutus]AFY93306.1 type 2 lantibiotic, mersacidin/lichenicidin family [Chamaesiphon minutus PCC 6605]
MSHENIIRTWKDENFRNSLSKKERALLPANPAGLVELSDADLNAVAGGAKPKSTSPCCTHATK